MPGLIFLVFTSLILQTKLLELKHIKMCTRSDVKGGSQAFKNIVHKHYETKLECLAL